MKSGLEPGQIFAGYRIDRLLGAGGMGEVYLARDRDLPRPVALKLLTPIAGDDRDVRARFLREADTAARLSHPNIVAVYARGEEQGRLWMAIQYIEGTDVAAVLRRGPVRPDHAVRITEETARALDHAHAAGVLHRDVKPANILLAWGEQQQVYLSDFGIAKALDRTDGLTRTGELYASFHYAAPEQFEMRPDIDRRADVYSLGCTLYYLLTGRLPYPAATTGALVNAHLNAPVPRPSAVDPRLPSGFDGVIARAMAKNRDERFSGCGELALAARRALTEPAVTVPAALTVPVPPPAAGRPAGPRSPRRRLLAVLAAVVVVAVFGATAWFTGLVRGGDHPVAPPPADAKTAAEQAACAYTALVASYDYDDPAGWEQKVQAGATGQWKSQAATVLPMARVLISADPERSRAGDTSCTATMTDGDTRADVQVQITTLNQVAGEAETARELSVSTVMELVDGRWLCSVFNAPFLPS
ncbi:serine/threonine protein kinase [Nocardia zapadnayensis]|uniref:serine/threonine-protein kinase n=1 Tax=Nocardia rhamnosiphila TaxID=426716 RepID=UPI0022467D0E|nr:serine/threonine-protein kinase [Nocardia zapadnayensis]MCX0275556.1 serine/threonine protein kinase [Nocardia zapadnayensis]